MPEAAFAADVDFKPIYLDWFTYSPVFLIQTNDL